MKKILLFIIGILIGIPAVLAHVEEGSKYLGDHTYTIPVLLVLSFILIVCLLVYERLGDGFVGTGILWTGLIISFVVPLFYPENSDLSADAYIVLSLLLILTWVFVFLFKKMFHKSNKGILLLIIFGFLLVNLIFAHDLPSELKPEKEFGIFDKVSGYIWSFHDRIHWVFVILMFYTCYHFRYLFSRKGLRQPARCFECVDKSYHGERAIHKHHRQFWRVNLFLIAIHWSEVIYGLSSETYNYTFSYQSLGIFLELFYVVAFTLWLFSCFFFKYLSKENYLSKKLNLAKPYCAVGRLNTLHWLFTWNALISFILLILVTGHL